MCMGRSMSVGEKVGTTEVAPSREGLKSTVEPCVPTAQHRSTCTALLLRSCPEWCTLPWAASVPHRAQVRRTHG